MLSTQEGSLVHSLREEKQNVPAEPYTNHRITRQVRDKSYTTAESDRSHKIMNTFPSTVRMSL